MVALVGGVVGAGGGVGGVVRHAIEEAKRTSCQSHSFSIKKVAFQESLFSLGMQSILCRTNRCCQVTPKPRPHPQSAHAPQTNSHDAAMTPRPPNALVLSPTPMVARSIMLAVGGCW